MTQLELYSETENLFEQLAVTQTLRLGFKAVKANRGKPGIDRISIKEYETRLDEELAQLRAELTSWNYKPQPVRRVEIPKPDGGVRLLGVPCIRDRVVQASLKLLLEPIFDPHFSDSSYGFRPKRSQEIAVKMAKKIVNTGKDYVVDMWQSKVARAKYVKFLGLTIFMGAIVISNKTMERAMAKVKELTPRRTHKPLETSIKEINNWYRGWSNYYKITQYPSQLSAIEAHIRRRLRVRLIRNMKRRNTIAKCFIKAGVERKTAYKTAFSNHRWWKLSHTSAAHKTFSNKWFVEQGLFTQSGHQHSHWFDVKDWIKIS